MNHDEVFDDGKGDVLDCARDTVGDGVNVDHCVETPVLPSPR